MTRQARLTGTKPLKDKNCPSCGNKLTDKKLGIPGDHKIYCSYRCLIVSKL